MALVKKCLVNTSDTYNSHLIALFQNLSKFRTLQPINERVLHTFHNNTKHRNVKKY